MNYRTAYTAKESEHLRILFAQGNTDEQIAAVMGRTLRSVADHRRKLRLLHMSAVDMAVKKSKHWSRDEVDFICNFWKEKNDKWMAKKLKTTEAVYKNKRRELGFQKHWRQKKGLRRSWTFSDEEFLRQHYTTHSAKNIAALMKGRHTPYAIICKANKLGLRKETRPGRHGFPPIDLRDPYYQPLTRTQP